jgi:hypothetical protein
LGSMDTMLFGPGSEGGGDVTMTSAGLSVDWPWKGSSLGVSANHLAIWYEPALTC